MRDNCDGHAGVDRRKPRATQQDYLTLSRLSSLLGKNVEKYLLEKDAMILDLGCGRKPYQPFFLHKSSMYIGADIDRGELVDICCSCERLPFKDLAFSAIVCTQVLEHADDPWMMVDEILRVLKPGGLLFLSTHGSWPIHGCPHDYWRWTEQGLRKLFADFHIYEISKCGGPVASMIQLLDLFIPERSLGVVIVFVLNKLGDFLDGISWLNARLPNLATNYFLVAATVD